MEKKQIEISSEPVSIRIQADFLNGEITANSRVWQSQKSSTPSAVQPEKLGLMLNVLEVSMIKCIIENFDAYMSNFEGSETNKDLILNKYKTRLKDLQEALAPIAAENSEEAPSTEEEGAATANDSSEA